VQLRGEAPVDVAALAARLRVAGEVVANAHLVRLRAPDAELVVFADGRAIVRGTAEASRARAVLARYVGV
jgi:adenylyltransferase/sulfurtransferase